MSLLPLAYGACGVSTTHLNDVQLRDCQGTKLKVTGFRAVSLVVKDNENGEAELEHSFLIADVKSCILSLGQLYQNGWSVRQMDEGNLCLESPCKELKIPVFYQHNSLAIRASVCRVEEMDGAMEAPVNYIRAIVELEDKFRPDAIRMNHWQVADGYPFMRSIGTRFIDPRPTWAGNFGYRTTLVQCRSLAEEDHGWNVAEVSRKYLELEDAFGPIPDLESFAQGEDVVILTILSERDEVLASFGGLLDGGGYDFEEPYEPESPYRGLPGQDDLPPEGLEIQPVLDEGRDDVVGREIPEFQELAPALREDAEADTIVVNDVQLTADSSVEAMRTAGRFLGISTAGSKRKIFERIKSHHISSLRLRALEIARGEYEATQPHPRYRDAPAQPSMRERKLHEVTHLPFKPWCSVCVQGKSRSDHQRPTPPDEMSQRTYPTVQCDFYFISGNLNVLIMVDYWTKYVAVEPLRNKLQSVAGGVVARFLGELGYFDRVELCYDNEPVLAAGMRVAQTIRSAQGLETILQPNKMYHKGRTALAERSIQSVRSQGKCLMIHVENKTKVAYPADHPLRAWAVLHAAWLLNRFHVSSTTGTTSFMSLRGRPYKGKTCAFCEEVFALDSLQAKYSTQWRRGIWLGKDATDMDLVAVSPTEIIRSRAIRKVAEHWNAELTLALEVGPWDLKRGVNTEVKPALPADPPLPLLHAPVGGVEPEFDDDEKAVLKYAQENPREDLDEDADPVETSEEGGASGNPPIVQAEDQAMFEAEVQKRDKRAAGETKLPIPLRQRVAEAEAEASKRAQHAGEEGQAKFVRFDPDAPVVEPSPKQQKTSLYSPVYAGDLPGSPGASSTSRHVRRVVEELELYDEDELEVKAMDEPWDWEQCESQWDFMDNEVLISDEEMRKRGFYDEGAGPPTVSDQELTGLDQAAMKDELERLKKLDVIEDAGDDLLVEEAMTLDTRLVRDWRFRDGRWKRRARLVAREFRAGDASNAETFSPTTPLSVVKMLIVLSLVHGLAIASIDVGDAFLQVPQSSLVLIEIPLWALGQAAHGQQKKFWALKRCLPGHRVAASEWNKFFTEVCERHCYDSFQGTIFRHKKVRAFLSSHIDDLLVVGPKDYIEKFYKDLSEELKLKMEGPLQPGDEGSIFYLKREI